MFVGLVIIGSDKAYREALNIDKVIQSFNTGNL